MNRRMRFYKRGLMIVLKIVLLVTIVLTVQVNAEPGRKYLQPPYNVGFYFSNTFRRGIYEHQEAEMPIGSSSHSMLLSVSVGRTVVPHMFLNRAKTVDSNLESGVSLMFNLSSSRDASISSFLENWYGTDNTTSRTSIAFNGYTRWNVSTQNRFIPFLGVLAGFNVAESKNVSDTELKQNGSTLEETHTETSTGGTSASVGFQLGANYFINYNLSFNCQYDRNIPLSDVPGMGMLSLGARYWF